MLPEQLLARLIDGRQRPLLDAQKAVEHDKLGDAELGALVEERGRNLAPLGDLGFLFLHVGAGCVRASATVSRRRRECVFCP
eukprot:764708-Prymnesium_polylepis.2